MVRIGELRVSPVDDKGFVHKDFRTTGWVEEDELSRSLCRGAGRGIERWVREVGGGGGVVGRLRRDGGEEGEEQEESGEEDDVLHDGIVITGWDMRSKQDSDCPINRMTGMCVTAVGYRF